MSRIRALASLAALASAAALLPATPAQAATPLTARISCGATGTVTTELSGNLFPAGTPATQVRVEFQRRNGSQVTATAWNHLGPLPQPFVATATTTTTGDVVALGYTGTFDAAESLYYGDNLEVTIKRADTGATVTTRSATCAYDQRTTLDLICDPAAGTVTAVVTGRDGLAGDPDGFGRPSTVNYRITTTSQATADTPRFTAHPIGPGPGYAATHRVTRAADGSWSDTGYVHTIPAQYYYDEELTVEVLDAWGSLVGRRIGRCTLYDESVTSAA